MDGGRGRDRGRERGRKIEMNGERKIESLRCSQCSGC